MFTFSIKIYGCQMNYADAERIVSILESAGGRETTEDKADYLIAVGCGVRASADERCIGWIKKMREINPKARIILTGCLSQRKDIMGRLGETVDRYIPIEEWPEKINLFKKTACSSPFYDIPPSYTLPYTALIPVMTGCNNFCSYCVVPDARGREKSFPPEQIIREVKKLLGKGCKEIILLGQNVNSYKGKDQTGKEWSFYQLAKSINALKGDFWIKFISSHPKDVDNDFIKILKLKKVSNHLHLPVQSGSNRILKAMNRKYTREKYLNLVKRIRRAVPDLILTSDFIVGFPGETEEDFKQSLDLAKKANFEMLYIGRYSPRPDTAAFKLEDSISPLEKKNREKRLNEIWQGIALKNNQKYINRNFRVLIDSVRDNGYAYGHTFDDKRTRVKLGSSRVEKGDFIKVKITKSSATNLEGEVL